MSHAQVAGLLRSRGRQEQHSGIGAEMELSISRAGLVGVALRFFGLPLASLVGGAMVGAVLAGEPGSMIGGLAGCLALLAWNASRGHRLVEMLELELHPPAADVNSRGGSVAGPLA